MDIADAPPAYDDFQDWEVLDSDNSSAAEPVNNSFDVTIDGGGLIQANYFSLDAQTGKSGVESSSSQLDDDDESDNPSWIDPGMEEDDNPSRFLNKESNEFWSDSSSDPSEVRKLTDLEARNEENQVGFRGIEVEEENKGEMMDGKSYYSDSSGTSEVVVSGVENLGQKKIESDGEVGKRGVVWWKMPIEVLKYCVFRMSPVWTVSVAAAVMGFVILGRRLYKMKRKSKGLQIKVTVDDKKVSQVMSRAARLNEAFSVVKRVPVIRPALPAVGGNTWPVMSLR